LGDKKNYLSNLKRDTQSSYYESLVGYIDIRISDIDSQWAYISDLDDLKRLQGRRLELTDLRKHLVSRPVEVTYDHSYAG